MKRVQKLCTHLTISPVGAQTNVLPPEDVQKLTVEELRERYGQAKPDALKIDGINHIAFVSSDMARTVWFWSEALGLRLTKTIQLADGGQHFFMEGGRGAAIAYFWWADAPQRAPGIANVDMENMTNANFQTAHGSVNHVAFNVPSEKLREYRKRIKATGSIVTPILYHTDETESGYGPKKDENTTWESFYFTGPDGEYLELTSQTSRPFTPERDILHKPATKAE
mmetsp:Transcript_15640/g.18951  ORF Transcript_15640/g.18951 Transcript_15640/m.18951 type:complete len:225 (+) Transcript_15640:40-714(+)|eukprot:CAMPEP_0184009088 /NCGR_PEP_ID=MMETSP0954-20121128/2385_1 /TAXON_ID=627963 /ORGANISM="Aplanochytrium sp, Strain PBS07" /LENGTH=224 /DNA_ID=CAMNT_0026288371 /DNA_START=40 /DNA_END=714 /DNA_ORIENTATION=+